jgi:hypothetical protein
MAGKKTKEAEVDVFPTAAEAAEAPSKKLPERVPGAPVPPTDLEGFLALQAAPPCETCAGQGITARGGAGQGDTLCPACRGTGKGA